MGVDPGVWVSFLCCPEGCTQAEACWGARCTLRSQTRTLPWGQRPLHLPQSSRFFGWRLFWVVLEHGVLSWYRRQ